MDFEVVRRGGNRLGVKVNGDPDPVKARDKEEMSVDHDPVHEIGLFWALRSVEASQKMACQNNGAEDAYKEADRDGKTSENTQEVSFLEEKVYPDRPNEQGKPSK